MGQQNSKTSVSLPKDQPRCFPLFRDEKELLIVCKQAAKSLSKLRELLGLVTGLVFDASQMTTTSFCLSTVSALIQFAIDRLCDDDVSSNMCNNNTLEDSLLEMKIDKCIVKSAVLGLKAKLTAISNRYDRLLNHDISTEDRRLEVIPALVLCEEIVELFKDQENVFAKNPLVSTPFMVTFGGVYVAVAELSLVILPSYQSFLVKQINCLGETLQWYKNACIHERQDALKLKRPPQKMPDSWMEGVCQPLEVDVVEEFHLHDPFMNNRWSTEPPPLYTDVDSDSDESTSTIAPDGDEFILFQSKEDAIAAYKGRLEDKYDAFFDGTLKNVADFSGFVGEDCKVVFTGDKQK